jgi:hypothetical protein
MPDSLPLTNQPYSDSIFMIAAYKLFDQAPAIVKWALDSITSKLSSRPNPTNFKDILPASLISERSLVITIHYPEEKKVTYFWICQKLMQLLLWNESNPTKNLDDLVDLYKISFVEISENVLKIQQIISDYANHLTPKPKLLGSDSSHPIESTILPSY